MTTSTLAPTNAAPTLANLRAQLPDPRIALTQLFPLLDHPLYGSLASFSESPYLLPAPLADFTQEHDFADVTQLQICPSCFFNTSGTTSRSKQIPYTDNDLDRQRLHEAVALQKLGLSPGMGVISLGAPLPSISGWAIVNGCETAGANVLNTSQIDYEDVITRGQQAKANVVIGTPLVMQEIGHALADEFGPLTTLFPNLDMAIIFGDVLPDAMRLAIQKQWGFKRVYSLYGTVEADVVATECPQVQGQMELMHERLIFELIPEQELTRERNEPGYVGKAIDLADAPNGVIGEILLSDLDRDVLPLIRYRIGDVVQVHRDTGVHNLEYPTISVLGRSKNTVLLARQPLYEMQLADAIQTGFGNGINDWRVVQTQAAPARYTLQLAGAANPDLLAPFWDKLIRLQPKLDGVFFADCFDVEWVTDIRHDSTQKDAKTNRIQLI